MSIKKPYRLVRIADLIKRELTWILRKNMLDPRFQKISINAVTVSRDLAYADLLVTPFIDESAQEYIELLNKASGHLRYELAQKIKLRTIPKLRFKYDQNTQRSVHLQQLIDQVNSPKDMNND
jgi:ribosome-binding factor A